MRLRIQLAVVILVLAAAGCGDSSNQLQQVEQGLTSWSQTLRMAGRLRLDGAVPAEYLRQTTEAASDSLTKLSKQLQTVEGYADQKKALSARILALSDSAEKIKLATETDDNQQIRQRLEAIDPESRQSGAR